MSSLLDIYPTVLDWFNISLASSNENNGVLFTGKSLLPLLDTEPVENNSAVFMSQSYHEVTMNYPMRAVRTKRYKLIHNLNYQAAFPIDQDFYVSPTFQDLLNRTVQSQPLPWYKTLFKYYHRSEWELFDLKSDPYEIKNLAGNKDVQQIEEDLKQR